MKPDAPLPTGERREPIEAGASGTLATILTRPRLAEHGPDHRRRRRVTQGRPRGALGRDSGQSVATAAAGASRGASRETPAPRTTGPNRHCNVPDELCGDETERRGAFGRRPRRSSPPQTREVDLKQW